MPDPDPGDHIRLQCPAKLNLTLAVGPPRADHLHPIASVMVALDFGDTLCLSRLDQGPSRFTRRFADDAPKPQPIDWPIESDLAFRAHAKLEQHTGQALPIECELIKRIPAGAGLGGGSSNAAGMLVALRDLFNLAITDKHLLEFAQSLGADVVFLVHAILGQRAAIVTGIGEVIQPIDTLPSFHAVLVFPAGACPTAEVYRAFDRNSGVATIPEQLIQTWASAAAVPAAHNDLTDAAIKVCPSIVYAATAIDALHLKPRLTGSGSALFAIVGNQSQAIAIANTIKSIGLPACPAAYHAPSQPR